MRDLTDYRFVIPGACPPKGSRTPVGKGRATRESSKRVKPWMDAAVQLMLDGHGKPRASFSGPVYVGLTFYFKRPKVTEHEFPTAPNIGDLDKLVRCVLDTLTRAEVIEDDRFVVALIGAERAPAPRKLWGGVDVTLIEVGPALPRFCPARMPGGDWQDCVCGSPAACGEASVDHIPQAINAVPGPILPFRDDVDPALVEQFIQNYPAPNPFAPIKAFGVAAQEFGGLPPPAPELQTIASDVGGWVDRIQGPTDYGVCPRCERAPLKPGDNHSGVKCSSDTCDYWFCY